MKKSLFSAVLFLMTCFIMSSCLDDNTEYIYYNDTAISSFSLGTVNRYLSKKKADGTDSIYKRTLNASSYKFNIDHNRGVIWNSDSLPLEVDQKKIICNISAKNSGTVYIKSMTSDSVNVYKSSDSIDFTQPREFHVYNMTATAMRKYTVHVNVHKEVGDTCVWTKMLASNSLLGGLSNMRAQAVNGKLVVFGIEGEGETATAKVVSSPVSDGRTWTAETVSELLDAESYLNIVRQGETLYTLGNGKVISSTDGVNWITIADAQSQGIAKLVAASSARLYALNAEGKLMASDNLGESWTEEQLDDDASLLPNSDLSYTCVPLNTNSSAERVVIVGNRQNSDDTTAKVWMKVDEYGDNARHNQWNYIEFAADNKHMAQRLTNAQYVVYNNEIVGMGGEPQAGCTAKALTDIYQSADGGVTWRTDGKMYMPELNCSNKAFAVVSHDNRYWIICGGSGEVWQGRINQLLWNVEQEYFN